VTSGDGLPAPEPGPETRPFWQGCREGQLLGQVCAGCSRTQLYPRLACTQCGSEKLAWQPLSGDAEVATFTVVRRPVSPAFRERVPFVLAIVRLAEGPQLMTHLVNCQPEDVTIGMPVTVRFEARGDWALPVFGPRTSQSQPS